MEQCRPDPDTLRVLDPIPPPALNLLVAVGCGLLIGIEREQHKAESGSRTVAGVRTLTLAAVAGAVGAMLGPVALAIAGGTLGALLVAGYWRVEASDHPGLTSEVAALLAFLLGVLAMTEPIVAAALAVVVTAVLQYKTRLHEFARRVLTERELNDALVLLASALIVLPVLPDTPLVAGIDVDVKRLWLLVVMVMAISATGYVAIRALGPRLGLLLTGLAGGLVSSAAVIAGMGQRARSEPGLLAPCVAAAMAANVASTALFLAVTWTAAPALGPRLIVPIGAAIAVALGFTLFHGRDAWSAGDGNPSTTPGRPFHFGKALEFAAIIGAALVTASLLGRWLGDAGVLVAGALAGLADSHAAAASLGALHRTGRLLDAQAVPALLLAFAANGLTRCVLAIRAGGGAFATRIVPAVVAMQGAAWLAWFATDR